MNEILRRENETDFEWKVRLCIAKLNKEIDLDWSEIATLLNLNVSSDHLRKLSYAYKEFNEYIKNNQESNIIENTVEEDDFINQLREEKRAIQEERVKLQTEKLENNRWIREKARLDLYFEKMQESISKLQPLQNPLRHNHNISVYNKEGILPIGDTHYGKEVLIKGLKGEILNEYNDKVFESRMWKLLDETKQIVHKEELNKLHILLMGDLIDGILRMSQLQSLQYGIVDSTMKFAEFIANWLNELSQIVDIELYSVLGNHSQIRPLGSKNGEFPQENMEKIIMWYVQSRLENNPNITINKNENEFIFIDVLGLKVMASHGEENNIEQAIKDYITIYGERIDLFLSAHLHSKFEKSVGIGTYGDIEVQRVPSICGIDDFSMKLRRSARAGARLFVVEENKGKTISYDIILN
jgi:hypothetical protein